MRHLMLMAQDVEDVIHRQPFTVCVSNFEGKPVHLPKHITFGISLPSRAESMTSGPASRRAAGAKKKGENGSERSSNTDYEETWQEKVRVGLDDDSVRQEVLQLLERFQNMCNGRLGRNCVAKHRIELTSGLKLVFQAPHRAGQPSREIEEAKIYHMQDARAIETTLAKWTSPTVFAPKKVGTLHFCVSYRKLNVVTVRD